MNRRLSILGRLRRWKSGAARYVAGAFAVAYLTAGVAPCAVASGPPPGARHAVTGAHGEIAPESHAAHTHHGAHESHAGNAVGHDDAPTPTDHRGEHCPHCLSGTAVAHGDAGSSCLAFEDLTNAAAAHAKDAPQPLAPTFGPAAFTLPPPLASPRPPPLRVVKVPPVPLNVRNCVFLI